MARPEMMESIQHLFDDSSYAELAVNSGPHYRQAEPFPYIVFDSFLPLRVANNLAWCFPMPDNSAWTTHANPNVNRQFLGDETKYHPLFRQFSQAVNSRRFLLFLEALSGIDGLLPDPYFVGGGAMTASIGHKLAMHIDFNWHYKLRAHRRLNALFYLTPGWQPEWSGALRVQNKTGTVKYDYLPYFNRLIVFSTSEDSWHGQPVPLTCPEGVRRNVFSAFYYTAASPAQEADPHLTKYHDSTPYTAAPLDNYKKEAVA